MDESLFETLLCKGESETLDFKRDQYPFDKATDEQQSELLKDILAFANARRDCDAYILVGIEEVKGAPAVVHGVKRHLQDHSLQQFVNSRTQNPISFRYEAFTFNGVTCGIIQIPVQKRPVYTKKNFGKVRARTVYVRRGSSTDEADPDEIARMGAEQMSRNRPVFEVTIRPMVEGQGTLKMAAWLHNTGPGTGDDVVAIIQDQPVGVWRTPYQAWMDATTSLPGKALKLKVPINPGDTIMMFSIELGRMDYVLANPDRITFRVKILARDQPKLDLFGHFSHEEVRAMKHKALEPFT